MINQEIAQKNFKLACEVYEQSKDTIKELSTYMRMVSPDFSFETAMKRYDLVLQGILLRAAVEDGYFLEEEQQFIEKITDYHDIMSYFNGRGISISWNIFDDISNEQQKKLSIKMLAALKELADDFVTPFAMVDAVFPKDYCEELTTQMGLICTGLAGCDGDDLNSDVARSELTVSLVLIDKLIKDKWQEVKTKSNKSNTQNKTQGTARSNSLKENFLKKKDLNVNSTLLCNYLTSRKRYQECVIYIETDSGSGTGVIVTKDGYFITCAHVVASCQELYVKVVNNDKADVYEANVITSNDELDLAICKIEEYNGQYAELDFGRSKADLGEEIALYGFPFGKRMNDDVMELNISYTRGYVSSYQTIKGHSCALLDISAKAGNSGSPVVSCENGKIIGFLSGSILGGNNNREEVNYMIPISELECLICSLIRC